MSTPGAGCAHLMSTLIVDFQCLLLLPSGLNNHVVLNKHVGWKFQNHVISYL